MTTTTIPASAVADAIVPWGEVREGDLILWDGEFRPVQQVAPYGAQADQVWAVEFADIPGEICIPAGTYAAVRRYTTEDAPAEKRLPNWHLTGSDPYPGMTGDDIATERAERNTAPRDLED